MKKLKIIILRCNLSSLIAYQRLKLTRWWIYNYKRAVTFNSVGDKWFIKNYESSDFLKDGDIIACLATLIQYISKLNFKTFLIFKLDSKSNLTRITSFWLENPKLARIHKFNSKILLWLENQIFASKIEIRPDNRVVFEILILIKNILPLIRSWPRVCPKHPDFATVSGLRISYKTHSSFFQAWAFLFPPHVTCVLKTPIGSKYVLSTSSKRIGSSFSNFFQDELMKIEVFF